MADMVRSLFRKLFADSRNVVRLPVCSTAVRGLAGGPIPPSLEKALIREKRRSEKVKLQPAGTRSVPNSDLTLPQW